MEPAVAELMSRFPNIDRMMAETLMTLHTQGKLEQYHDRLSEEVVPKTDCVFAGIQIDPPPTE